MTTTTSVVDSLVEALAAEDIDALVALYAPGVSIEHPLAPPGESGIEAFAAAEQALFDAFDDVRPDVRNIIASGDQVAVELVMRAKNTGPLDLGAGDPIPATGRRIDLPAVWLLRLDDDGLITEEHTYFDTATFMRQLGLAD